MADTLTISVKFKLADWYHHRETLLELCNKYSACLKDGMTALIAQNEINVTLEKEEKKVSGLTVSRRAMPTEYPSNMKDSACQEVASTWKSYSALWDKQANRSFPTFKGDGLRFRLRERALKIDHDSRVLTIMLPGGNTMEFGYLGSNKMYEVLENCSHGAFDVLKEKGECVKEDRQKMSRC